ncbi:mediator complex subunit 18 [Columba livia]|uniref:Mediator of RNA polymerase II transcription subunit 18 n=1 Tax=Columba livia TaxID=8932 RepID=A0A2I0M141_COLLI|nr:mediator of RNA polymerase II transcription subunit 18 [Columba livia]PKK23396.1 mediator complex subunit 18 [Columba livia]
MSPAVPENPPGTPGPQRHAPGSRTQTATFLAKTLQTILPVDLSQPPFVLRARRSMDKGGMPWHLRYLGQPEIGDKNRHALVRNCVDIATSDNLTDFLVEMGFRMDHEFVAKGHVFRKGIMKIVVYKIFRILMPGNTESIEPLSLSYLVELNVVAPAGQDVVSDDMRNFAEQLKPLVHLEKIDPKRLM